MTVLEAAAQVVWHAAPQHGSSWAMCSATEVASLLPAQIPTLPSLEERDRGVCSQASHPVSHPSALTASALESLSLCQCCSLWQLQQGACCLIWICVLGPRTAVASQADGKAVGGPGCPPPRPVQYPVGQIQPYFLPGPCQLIWRVTVQLVWFGCPLCQPWEKGSLGSEDIGPVT